jgi:acetoin utilization deacetylase AcuC-like enzyme
MSRETPDALRVYTDPVVLLHDTGPFHPETAARVTSCLTALRSAGWEPLGPVSPGRVLAAVERVHTPGYVARFREAVSRAPEEAAGKAFGLFDSPDNAISAPTFSVALRSVGLVLAAVDDVVAGRTRAGFVVVRPPGHHALAQQAMGFCFFNTIAVAARDLGDRHGLGRVLVADFDVHHGNGTQEIFWEDGHVAYLSVHRYPFYPGTGGRDEIGSGRGLGLTVNVPRPAGAQDEAYAGGFEEALFALADRFKPEMVLVSAGFDAHDGDPLGGMRVSTVGFARMTRAVRQVAREYAGGRIVSVLEGGYDPEALATSSVAHASVLDGRDEAGN